MTDFGSSEAPRENTIQRQVQDKSLCTAASFFNLSSFFFFSGIQPYRRAAFAWQPARPASPLHTPIFIDLS